MSKSINKYFLDHFKKLKIKKNDNILVYSDLSKIGIVNKQLPKIILTCLKSCIGKGGTLVMPFYNFEKKKNFIFNKKKFINSSVIGALNREFSKEKKIIRSNCIIHNHIGIGSSANILKYSNENYSLGKNSDFEFFKIYNFKLLMLACDPIQGATYLHHLEALNGVPYRKWVILKRKKIENGDKKTIKIKYYAQKNYNYVTDFNRVFDKISKKTSFLREQSVKYGKSYIIRIKDLDKVGLNFLKKNKYSFVKKNNDR